MQKVESEAEHKLGTWVSFVRRWEARLESETLIPTSSRYAEPELGTFTLTPPKLLLRNCRYRFILSMPVYISPPVSSLGSVVAKGLKSPTHIDAGHDAAFGPPSPRINLWTQSLGSRTLLTILL